MIQIPDSRSRMLILLALAGLLAATRGQFFAPLGHHLPDATLAVLFLAGVYLRPLWVFPALFLLATLIDVMAIGWGGVSAFCVTPAYWMLVPAYGALYGAGRWYAARHRERISTLPTLAGAVLVGGVAAEVLASGGFYLLSGRFAEPSFSELLQRLATYMPAVLITLAAYVALGAVAHQTLSKLAARRRAEVQ